MSSEAEASSSDSSGKTVRRVATKRVYAGSEMRFRWTLARGTAIGLTRAFQRVSVHHSERLPTGGAYILAPSHRSSADFLFVGCLTGRPLRFMIKEEIWKHPRLGDFVMWFGAFPVSRGKPDRAALRMSSDALEAGDALVIFPEGTRCVGPEIMELHEGAAFLALRAKVPIVPVGIGGSSGVFVKGKKAPRLFRKIHVVVGEPIFPDEGDGPVRRSRITETTNKLRESLQKCFNEAEALSTGPSYDRRPTDS